MNPKIFAGLLIVFLLFPGVQGLTWVESCINETHMYKEAVLNVSGTPYPLEQTIYCEYNCSTDYQRCNPPPKEKADDSVLTAIIVGLAIVTSLFFYLAIHLTISRDSDGGPIEHRHLQPLFFLFGMVFITGMFFIMGQYADSSSQAGIQDLMWALYIVSGFILVFVAIYVMIIFIKSLGDWLKERSKDRKERGK